ncbi:MAG: hypothetical protein IMZ51_03785 [Chloroflexi bacterium]|nr:hypothetical protein [Chloroflexota bacterium]
MKQKEYEFIDDLIKNHSFEVYRNIIAKKDLVVSIEDLKRVAKQHFGKRWTAKIKKRKLKEMEGLAKMLIDIYGKDGAVPYIKILIGVNKNGENKK